MNNFYAPPSFILSRSSSRFQSRRANHFYKYYAPKHAQVEKGSQNKSTVIKRRNTFSDKLPIHLYSTFKANKTINRVPTNKRLVEHQSPPSQIMQNFPLENSTTSYLITSKMFIYKTNSPPRSRPSTAGLSTFKGSTSNNLKLILTKIEADVSANSIEKKESTAAKEDDSFIQLKELDKKFKVNSAFARRYSLRRPCTANKSSIHKEPSCSPMNIPKSIGIYAQFESYKHMQRLYVNKRVGMSRAPVLVFGFKGLIGDFMKINFFNYATKLYLKSGNPLIRYAKYPINNREELPNCSDCRLY